MNQEKFEERLHAALEKGWTVHVPNFYTDPQFANVQMTVDSIVKKLSLARTQGYQFMGEFSSVVVVKYSFIALSDAAARTAKALKPSPKKGQPKDMTPIHVLKTLDEFVDDMDSGNHVLALLDAPSVNGEVPACLR